MGMRPTIYDKFLYTIYKERKFELVILICVDDIPIMAGDSFILAKIKKFLNDRFLITVMDKVWVLGMSIIDAPKGI